MAQTCDLSTLKSELTEAGVFEHRTSASWGKFLFMLAAFIGIFLTMLALPGYWGILLLPIIAIPVVTAAMIGHEAGHRSFAGTARHNEIAYHILFPLFSGLGALHWKNKHNVRHHNHPNVVGKDDDLNIWPMTMSVAEHEQSGPIRRFLQLHLQGFLFWPLTLLLPVVMRMESMLYLRRHAKVHGYNRVFWADAGCQLVHYVMWLIIPSFFFSPWLVIGFYLSMWAFVGLYLSLIFAPAHMGLPLHFTRAKGWEHQLHATRNLKLPRFMSWFFVGLDYQVEHHLFPNIPHQNIPKASAIVRRWCEERNLPWQEIGYGAALVSVTRFLHREWREGLLTEFGDPVTQLANRDL